jgi:hydroxymethylpyrimidine/phosphomethylpyrimidine kinase
MDLRVFADLRAVGMAVVAAVTAQNNRRVIAAGAIAPALITQQLEAVWEQVKPDAVCIGLLPDAPGIKAIGTFLKRLARRPPIVIDPVIAASSGSRFVGPRARRELVRLWPLATVVTPNLDEAAVLSKMKVTNQEQAESAARTLALYGSAVLVTGGHLKGATCADILVQGNSVRRFAAPRVAGAMRGAGGILAAGLAVFLARGASLERAVEHARLFVRRSFRNADTVGSGQRQYVSW